MQELGLPVDASIPMLGFIGRLDYQKGVDLITESFDWLMDQGVQLILLGSGREDLENSLRYTLCLQASLTVGKDDSSQGSEKEALNTALLVGADFVALISETCIARQTALIRITQFSGLEVAFCSYLCNVAFCQCKSLCNTQKNSYL